jgi:flagellar hook-length control protein FliK
MNVNMLTIDSNLAAATEASPFPSKPDSNNKGARFALALDDEKVQVKIPEKPTADNIKEKVQNHKKSISNSPQEFTQSSDKKIKPEVDPKQRRDSDLMLPSIKTDVEAALFDRPNINNKSGQPNGVDPTLAEIIQGLEGTKAKSALQPTQIATDIQDKSASVTGQAVKSTEIKLLHTTEKGQLGIKTILPTNSNGQNGLKTVTPDLTKSISAIQKQPEASNNNEKTVVSAKTIALNEKVNAPEKGNVAVKGNTPEKGNVSEKGNIKESAPETSVNSGKSTNATGVKPSVMNVNLRTVQDKTSETKPNSGQVNTEKLKLTDDTDSKTKKSENIPNLSNQSSKESIPAGNNISENKSVQKLNAASVQVISGQTKDQSNSTSNKSPSQGFEQILSHNNSQTLITEQSSVPAKNAATANPQNQPQNNASADIGRQILESVQSSMSRQGTEQQITVRLNPPELGKVLIRFQQQDNELTGLMEVNKTQTRLEIEQALPQIIRNLADCGIHIRRLEVILSNEQQPGQGTLGNQSLQNGGAQQQYSSNQGPSGNDSALSQHNEWLSGNNSYENLSEFQETFITDGSINLLI